MNESVFDELKMFSSERPRIVDLVRQREVKVGIVSGRWKRFWKNLPYVVFFFFFSNIGILRLFPRQKTPGHRRPDCSFGTGKRARGPRRMCQLLGVERDWSVGILFLINKCKVRTSGHLGFNSIPEFWPQRLTTHRSFYGILSNT